MNVGDLLLGGSAWWVLPCSLLTVGATFGLLPGLMLRLIVLLYPKGHPRREELFGELYDPDMGRFERFEWVFQQLETAFREGPASRKHARSARRASKTKIGVKDHEFDPMHAVLELPDGVQLRAQDLHEALRKARESDESGSFRTTVFSPTEEGSHTTLFTRNELESFVAALYGSSRLWMSTNRQRSYAPPSFDR
jgi:hypothetical protein